MARLIFQNMFTNKFAYQSNLAVAKISRFLHDGTEQLTVVLRSTDIHFL